MKDPELTGLINRMGAGDGDARAKVFEECYEEMLEIARRTQWKGGPAGQTQSIELVHDGLLRIGRLRREWRDRRHFLSTFALALKTSRIDAYRAAQVRDDDLADWIERGADRVVEPDGLDVDLIALEQALEILGREHPDAAAVVRLRFFTQSTHEEVAEDLGVPVIRARRLWGMARNRLRRLLGEGHGTDDGRR